MKRVVTLLVLTGALTAGAVALAPAAGADPVPVGGLWQEFWFDGAGSFATACSGCLPSSSGNSTYAPNPPWTFSLDVAGTLTVTDAFARGDEFEVYDSGVSLGTTSAVPTDNGCNTDDPLACLGVNSSRVFNLAPGPHSITIKAVASPYGGGAGYFLVKGAAPFAGTPGKADCNGQSVAALNKQFGSQAAAAAALGYASVGALHQAIKTYCGS